VQNRSKAYTYAAFTILFWGTAATAFKLSLRTLSPLQLLFVSNIVALAILLTIVLASGKIHHILGQSKREWLKSIALGFLNPFAYYLVLFEAYNRLPAQLAQPLNFVWPITLVLLAVPLLKQKLKRNDFIALLVSFFGVYLLASQGEPFTRQFADGQGVFFALFSSVIWSLFWLFNVRDRRDESVKLFLNFFFSLIFVCLLVWYRNDWPQGWSVDVGAAAYVGIFEMGITFVLWLMALKLAPSAAKLGNVVYLTPFVALFFVSVILHEKIFYTTFIGLLLIIVGIVIQQKYGSSKSI